MAKTWLDVVKSTMGPIEKLAAIKTWWWFQREGVNVLDNLFSNKWRIIIGILVTALSMVDANDLLPQAYDDMLEGVIGLLTGLGLGVRSTPGIPVASHATPAMLPKADK